MPRLRRKRPGQCVTGKVPHASQADAQRAADLMNDKDDNLGVTTAYHCQLCLAWHIGREAKARTIIVAPFLGPAFKKLQIED